MVVHPLAAANLLHSTSFHNVKMKHQATVSGDVSWQAALATFVGALLCPILVTVEHLQLYP